MPQDRLRFYVLEDEQDEFLLIHAALRRTAELLGISSVEILWAKAGCPQVGIQGLRSYLGDFTAPLLLDHGTVQLEVAQRQDGCWVNRTQNPIEAEPWALVPWLEDGHGAYRPFMPHAVVLDFYTSGSSGESSNVRGATEDCTSTARYLERCRYPADLVWILSKGAVRQPSYGYFIPKPWRLERKLVEDGREELAKFWAERLRPHVQRVQAKRTRLNSYLPRAAYDFYVDVLERRPWESAVTFDEHTRATRKDIVELWCPRRSTSVDGDFEWRVAQLPVPRGQHARPVFTFFGDSSKGDSQWDYLHGRSFGLSIDILQGGSAEDPDLREPEEVLVRTVRILTDARCNDVIRRNAFLLLRMMIGHQTNFSKLNAALAGEAFGNTKAHETLKPILGGMSPDRYFKQVFLRGADPSRITP